MSGAELDIELLAGIYETPALTLAVAGWAECQEKGWGDGTLNIFSDIKAFLARVRVGQEIVPAGVLTFDYQPPFKRVWIYQSYVIPEMRGRGVYTAMFNKLVEYSIADLKAVSIQSGTHVRNTAMRAIAKKQGRYEECVTLRMNLQ